MNRERENSTGTKTKRTFNNDLYTYFFQRIGITYSLLLYTLKSFETARILNKHILRKEK